MKTDEICDRYAEQKVGLTLRLLEDDDQDADAMVLIEGTSNALKMLAELLLAVAEEKDGSFSISPFGAGNIHFSKFSQLGIYIHHVGD